MKFISAVLGTAVLLTVSVSAFAQKYKSVADTGKLNTEYVKVQNEIADLKFQLGIAQNNLPGLQTKASTAGADAQQAASSSSTDASKANDGNIGDAKTAKNSADGAYDKAKDAKSANNAVGKQDEKIRKLQTQLVQKQERLKDLDIMRAAINAQTPAHIGN